MAKKGKKVEIVIEGKPADDVVVEEGLPAWMATFADMVTLLLCFFVLLLSFTNQDISNFDNMKGSIQESFGVQKTDSTALKKAYATAPYEMLDPSASKSEQLAAMSEVLRAYVESSAVSKAAQVNTDQNGIMMRVASPYMFAQGSAQLKPGAQNVLNEVIKQLTIQKNMALFIRGHTDDQEQSIYNSKWVLSSARASACIRYILAHSKISPSRLIAVGYADSNPLAPNISEENRQRNRRVEFYFKLTDEDNADVDPEQSLPQGKAGSGLGRPGAGSRPSAGGSLPPVM